MLYYYIFFLSVLFSCSSPENGKGNSSKQNNLIESLDQNNQKFFTDTVGAKIIETLPIEVRLKVSVFSMDSIMAYVTFFNNGNKSIWLYYPIIRDTFLSSSSLVILDKNNSKLPYNGHVNKSNFYSKSLDSFLLVIPDLSTRNVIEFNPRDSIQLHFNLTRTFDFKVLKERNEKYFRIEYTCLFPYIEDGRHVYRNNNALKVIQPVYFILSTIRKESEAFRLEIELSDK